MQYNYKYRLTPPEDIAETLLHHVDICRQLYNHVLYKLNEADDIPARYEVQGRLPDLKSWWDDLGDVHSKVLQMVVKRVYDNLSTLKAHSRGLEEVGVVHSESTSPEIFDFWLANESQSDSSTPVETALPADTSVSAKRVVETGSPTLKERTAKAVSE